MSKKQEHPQNKPSEDDFAPEENKSFIPEEGEEELYHVKLTKSIVVNKVKIKTEEKVQKFKPKAFNQFKSNAQRLGFELEILHAPDKD